MRPSAVLPESFCKEGVDQVRPHHIQNLLITLCVQHSHSTAGNFKPYLTNLSHALSVARGVCSEG